MLSRLELYILRHLATTSLMATAAVTMVIWLSQSMRLLSLVVDSGASLIAFLHLWVLILPTLLPILLPLGLAIGILFTYQHLTQDHELVAMRALGLSAKQLAKPALWLAAATVTLCFGLTLLITPAANRELVRVQTLVRNDFAPLLMRPGSFTDLDDGLVYYAESREANGRMRGIMLQDNRQAENPTTIMAETGYIALTPSRTALLIIEKGMRQSFNRTTGQLEQLDFSRYSLDLSQIRNKADTRWPDPRERTQQDLLHPQGIDQHPDIRRLFFAELHGRLTAPWLAMIFALIALIATLGGAHNRRGRMGRMVLAFAGIAMLQAGSMALINLTSSFNPYVLALYALTFGALAFSYYWLKNIDSAASRKMSA